MGDPIEFDSIRKVFGDITRAEKLWVGSIKDNIGHTETSSGVAALIKTVLMIQKGRIPKQANFSRLNPKIPPPEQENVAISNSSIDWKSSIPAAMVTNYGAAGSNAAILVKQHSSPALSQYPVGGCASEVPIFISAKTPESLQAYCEALRSFITKSPIYPNASLLRDIAYNLSVKQNRSMEYMATFSTNSNDTPGFLNQLTDVVSNASLMQKKPKSSISVILCFGGQTGNTASISEELFNSCGYLRTHLVSLFIPSIYKPSSAILTNQSRWNVKILAKL